MLISELGTKLGFAPTHADYADAELSDGFTSDLLSDVMGKAAPGSILITIQAHRNTVAVCALAGIRAILICSSRPIPDDMLDAAKKEGIALFATTENQFRATGLVWDALKA